MSFTPASRAPIIWCPPRVGQAFNWNHAAAWASNNWLAEGIGIGSTVARDATVSKYGGGSAKIVAASNTDNYALCSFTAGGSANLTTLKTQLEMALALDAGFYSWVLVTAATGGTVTIRESVNIYKSGPTLLATVTTDYIVGAVGGIQVSPSTWYPIRAIAPLAAVSAADRALITQVDLRVAVVTAVGATATVHFDGHFFGRALDFTDLGPKQSAQMMSAFPETARTPGVIEAIQNGYVEHLTFATMREGDIEIGPFDQPATDAVESFCFNVIGAKQPFEIWSDRTLEDRHGMARCASVGGDFGWDRFRDYRKGRITLQEVP